VRIKQGGARVILHLDRAPAENMVWRLDLTEPADGTWKVTGHSYGLPQRFVYLLERDDGCRPSHAESLRVVSSPLRLTSSRLSMRRITLSSSPDDTSRCARMPFCVASSKDARVAASHRTTASARGEEEALDLRARPGRRHRG